MSRDGSSSRRQESPGNLKNVGVSTDEGWIQAGFVVDYPVLGKTMSLLEILVARKKTAVTICGELTLNVLRQQVITQSAPGPPPPPSFVHGAVEQWSLLYMKVIDWLMRCTLLIWRDACSQN